MLEHLVVKLIIILNFLKMKNAITTVLAIVLISTMAYSQTIKVTGGVDLMNIRSSYLPIIGPSENEPTDNVPTDTAKSTASSKVLNNEVISSTNTIKNTSNETGFYIGVALSDISLSESFGVLPEIRFVGVKDFNQIQVPILLKYHIVDKLSAVAGPNFCFLLDPSPITKGFNFAIDFGLSYDISDQFSIEGRYDWGQTNLLKNGDSNNYIKINNIQFGIAYSFGK